MSFLVPEGAQTLDFMPTLFNVESGTFDLDDVVMKATDPVPLKGAADARLPRTRRSRRRSPPPCRPRPRRIWPRAGSLIPNGDFETEAKKVTGGRRAGAEWRAA